MSELKQDEVLNEEIEKTESCCESSKECCEGKEEQKEESLEDVIARLEDELKQSEDKFLRVHADFENIKKRLEREKYQAIDYASVWIQHDPDIPPVGHFDLGYFLQFGRLVLIIADLLQV